MTTAPPPKRLSLPGSTPAGGRSLPLLAAVLRGWDLTGMAGDTGASGKPDEIGIRRHRSLANLENLTLLVATFEFWLKFISLRDFLLFCSLPLKMGRVFSDPRPTHLARREEYGKKNSYYSSSEFIRKI